MKERRCIVPENRIEWWERNGGEWERTNLIEAPTCLNPLLD